jgi:hypothetical protein
MPDDAKSDSKASQPEASKSEAGDPKDAFRAALERKRSQQHAHNAEAQGDGKIHGSQSSGGGKRTFRRKSGG